MRMDLVPSYPRFPPRGAQQRPSKGGFGGFGGCGFTAERALFGLDPWGFPVLGHCGKWGVSGVQVLGRERREGAEWVRFDFLARLHQRLRLSLFSRPHKTTFKLSFIRSLSFIASFPWALHTFIHSLAWTLASLVVALHSLQSS